MIYVITGLLVIIIIFLFGLYHKIHDFMMIWQKILI